MKSHEFLVEYRRDVTAQKLGDKLLASAKRENITDVDQILAALEDMDPTPNKQYMIWIAKQYINQQFRLEDSDRVNTAIQQFIQVKSRLQEKDIGKYDFQKLEDAMEKIFNPDASKKEKQPQGIFEIPDEIKDQVEVLYNGPLGLLTIPKTEEASCVLGSGTRWCTAGKQNNQFSYYNSQAPLYIWRDKNGEKYQFFVSFRLPFGIDYQFMDSNDRAISDNLIRYFAKDHPVLKKLFSLIIKRIFDTMESISIENVNSYYVSGLMKFLTIVADDDANTTEIERIFSKNAFMAYTYANRLKRRFPAGESAILADPKYSVAYAREIIGGRWPEAEKAIAKDPENAYHYAKDVIRGRFPEGEKAIAEHADWAHHYAIDVIRGRFPLGEKTIAEHGNWAYEYAKNIIGRRWPEAEKAIAKEPDAANAYAKYVIRGRWPEAERNILRSPWSRIFYAKDVIKGRWPEAENKMITHIPINSSMPYFIYEYLKRVVKRKRNPSDWPEGEAIMAANPDYAYKYAKNVIKGRWPPGEAAILKSPKIAVKYAKYVIGGRWRKAERIISSYAGPAAAYAVEIIKGRWPEAEKAIKRSPRMSYYYVKYALKDRFPEGEKTLAKDPGYACWYAEDIIGGRWPEAEPAIAKQPYSSLQYAKKVIKGRWPPGEAVIANAPYYREEYEKLFGPIR